MDTTTKTPKACIGDMFPSVFPGMPMFAYVPNPYDCGRPAKVYPGDNTYYCVKGAPLCAVDAEDAALLAIRRTVCRTMNQCYGAATPAQVAAVEAGIKTAARILRCMTLTARFAGNIHPRRYYEWADRRSGI